MSFYPEYSADNQIGKIIENDIFRRLDILSFTRLPLHYIFSKFTIKYSSLISRSIIYVIPITFLTPKRK